MGSIPFDCIRYISWVFLTFDWIRYTSRFIPHIWLDSVQTTVSSSQLTGFGTPHCLFTAANLVRNELEACQKLCETVLRVSDGGKQEDASMVLAEVPIYTTVHHLLFVSISLFSSNGYLCHYYYLSKYVCLFLFLLSIQCLHIIYPIIGTPIPGRGNVYKPQLFNTTFNTKIKTHFGKRWTSLCLVWLILYCWLGAQFGQELLSWTSSERRSCFWKQSTRKRFGATETSSAACPTITRHWRSLSASWGVWDSWARSVFA